MIVEYVFEEFEMMLEGARSTMSRMKGDMGQSMQRKCDMRQMRDNRKGALRRELSECEETIHE